MKVAARPSRVVDPRTTPLPLTIDDDGTARWVQSALTAEDAWRALGLPGGRDAVDPAAVAALAAAATALCATSDQIAKGLGHFGDLAPDADPPITWVDRMVTLYLDELRGFWALDDLAYAGLKDGGWTATQPGHDPPADEPATRIATRATWQAEHLRPKGAPLWLDKLERLLSQEEAIGNVDGAILCGEALVSAVAVWRFSHWRTTRQQEVTR